jgi:endonuclease-3
MPGAAQVKNARWIFSELATTYPDAGPELDFTSSLELLVATILSAQCTDRRVNAVTPILFAKYPDAEAYAVAHQEELEEIIRPTGFYRNKATTIVGMGATLAAEFGGVVPRTVEELVTIPGVGRKTAFVVMGNAFGLPGITIDTHFGRLARRFGWTVNTDPVKIERDIEQLFLAKDWTQLSHLVLCHARKPACGACAVAKKCPAFGEGPTDLVEAKKLVKSQGRA